MGRGATSRASRIFARATIPPRMRLPAAAFAALLATVACDQGATATATDVDGAGASASGLRLAHVNIDSVLAGYAYLSEQTAILEQRQQDASAEFERRARKLQGQLESFQRRAQAGNLTPKQIENEQRALQRSDQELTAEQQRLVYEFQGEGARLQSAVVTALRREVDALQAERGYDYVLSYGGGTSGVLAVNEAYDLTREVLARMNAGPAPELPDSVAADDAVAPLR